MSILEPNTETHLPANDPAPTSTTLRPSSGLVVGKQNEKRGGVTAARTSFTHLSLQRNRAESECARVYTGSDAVTSCSWVQYLLSSYHRCQEEGIQGSVGHIPKVEGGKGSLVRPDPRPQYLAHHKVPLKGSRRSYARVS